MARLWDQLEDQFPDVGVGWEWPRCVQKVTLLVGPTGAGKSTYTRDNFDVNDVISSDAIRLKLFNTLENRGDQSQIFERVRTEARMRLASGKRVVIDATHIVARDRIVNALLVPSDMPVEHVVIDRPMAEKLATADQRKPHVLEQHARIFEDNKQAIMACDDLQNVRVKILCRDGSRNGLAI